MTDTPIFEKAIRLANDKATYEVQAFRGYAEVIVLRIESDQGHMEYYIDPADASLLGNAFIDAWAALQR